jgi:sigma-B regulation protein RsbU (phosphoserine phosphatase)
VKVLIAEDDSASRRALERLLHEWAFEVITTADGEAAWKVLQEPDAPSLVILDVMMPGIDGLELCRRLRSQPKTSPSYIILLTASDGVSAIVKGIEAGADDYITKPYDCAELKARLQVGSRIVGLQTALNQRVRQLEVALNQVKRLEGILPICSYCKNIRDDQDYWQSVDQYISDHSEARFSHSICPACFSTEVEMQLTSFEATSLLQPVNS